MKTHTFIYYSILVYTLSIGIHTLQSQIILTKTETTDLTFLYEEEKLAYDVYSYAATKYDLPVFKNILDAEQRHRNKVKNILEQAGIKNHQTFEMGTFKNTELQALYNKLIKQVDMSLVDALKVGATIEDLDIFDVQKLKKRTDNKKILAMYSVLVCGSENHMRAFTKQLKKHNASYVAQYISEKEYKKILRSSNKPCGAMQKGKEKKHGKGKGMGKSQGHGNGQGRGQGRGRNRSW